MNRRSILLATFLAASIPGVIVASSVTIPTTFSNGTVADANEMNANFSAIKTAVDDNHARLGTLEAEQGGARPPAAGSTSYVQNGTTAQAASFNVSGTGTVGSGLNVHSQIRSVPAGGTVHANTGTAIDWNNGNVQTTTANCGAFTFSNMLEGGAYTLVVKGATAGTCTFAQSVPDAPSAFKFQPANGATTASTTTVYTFLRAGNTVYTSWITGF